MDIQIGRRTTYRQRWREGENERERWREMEKVRQRGQTVDSETQTNREKE